MLHRDIQLDVGGTLIVQPPETGRPSSATCAIYTPAGTSIATPTATVDTVNTTVAANASEGATSLTLTSATGVTARRHYVVVCDDGERLTVRVRAIRASVVDLYQPLPRDVDATSLFYGTRITAPVTSAQATPIGDGYEARWVYTVDGVVTRVNTRWSVTRSVWPDAIGTVAGLRDYAGRLLTPERESNHARNAGYLDEMERATRGLKSALIQRGRVPARFRSYAAFEDVTYQRVLLDMAEEGTVFPEVYASAPEQWLTVCRERYERMLTEAMAATADYDSDEDGAVSESEAEATPRYARLSR